MAERVPRRLVALVDCSAFYVSCERVFDPSLEGVPVAVLSNNDGCVIARSQEVKDAGVKMGESFFKCRARLAEVGAVVYSSNYTLYGDMSRRVMDTLLTVSPDVVPYSIDEAFVYLPTGGRTGDALREHADAWAREARRRVLQWTGIPVRVSVAETKTLAKAASEYARAQLKTGGEPVVCFTEGHPDREAFLEGLDVEDVWGVGRRWGARLRALGAPTASALGRQDLRLVRQRFNVVLARTVLELRGTPAVVDGDGPVTRKTMIRSRSFGEPVEDLETIRRAVATHAARAAEKLRAEGLVAGRVGAFCTTKGYGTGPHRTGWVEGDLVCASNRTPDVIRAALAALARGHVARDDRGRPYRYRKAGVILGELRPEGTEQHVLFEPDEAAERTPEWNARQARIMAAVDAANRRFGRRAVAFGSMGAPSTLRKTRDGSDEAPRWEMRRESMSPRYTTRWTELVIAKT